MARSAGGVMSLVSPPFAIPNTAPSSTTVNTQIADILNEITDSLSRSGKGGMLADLAMGTHKITGLTNGSAATDAAAFGQIQTSVANQATTVGGTADAITAGFTPAIVSLTTNLALRVTATGANTITNPVINVDGLGNKTIKKLNGQALSIGDIAGAGHVMVLVYNGTDMLLLNPASSIATGPAASTTVAGIVELATAAEYQANTPDRALSNTNVWSAATTVTLTDAATVAVDMGTFLNATVTLGGNRTLGQPTNTKVGQSGFIRINQDATGTRTLAFHIDWKFVNGTDPVLSTAPNTTDVLFYQVIAANFIYASLSKALA